MKEFVARRGPPQVMESDNGRTFFVTKKWLKTFVKNEDVMNVLAIRSISGSSTSLVQPGGRGGDFSNNWREL